MKALKKLRAWLHRPDVQIIALMLLVGVSGTSTDSLIKVYREGAPITPGVVGLHVVVLIALTVTFNHFDRVEARMKAGDDA